MVRNCKTWHNWVAEIMIAIHLAKFNNIIVKGPGDARCVGTRVPLYEGWMQVCGDVKVVL